MLRSIKTICEILGLEEKRSTQPALYEDLLGVLTSSIVTDWNDDMQVYGKLAASITVELLIQFIPQLDVNMKYDLLLDELEMKYENRR